MGWKGTLRSVNAELKRQSREADKRYRQHIKELEREDARNTVANFEQYLEHIVSLHKTCGNAIDWASIELESKPEPPSNEKPLTTAAEDELTNYKPGFFTKLLRLENRSRKKLADEIVKAKQADKEGYIEAKKKYKSDVKDWEENQILAKKIKIDGESMAKALQKYLNINDLPIKGEVQISVSDIMQVDVSFKILPYDEIIPDESYSLKQSGTLSKKKMPKGKGLDLYQDYACSALLKLARDILSILPIDTVNIHTLLNTVNSKTGHLEDQIIISAYIVRETLQQINFRMIDPSDSLSNFVHNMSFKKTKGFDSVDKVNIS